MKIKKPSGLTVGMTQPLFGESQTPESFKKAVEAVHSIPKTHIGLLEGKIANAWIQRALTSQADAQGWHSISIRDLAESVGFDSNNIPYLIDAARKLMTIAYEWDVLSAAQRGAKWEASVLFPNVQIRDSEVRFVINREMRPILENPAMYALVDMNVIRKLRRSPSLRLYEHCVRFETIGRTSWLPWETLRDIIMGEPSGKLVTRSEYKYFKARVLRPCIAELNESSHHIIELQEKIQGRKVTDLQFTIKRKASAVIEYESQEVIDLVGQLARWQVPPSMARKVIAEYGIDAVKSAIHYTRQRLDMVSKGGQKIDKPGAYFHSALRAGYQPKEANPKGATTAKTKRDLMEEYLSKRTTEAKGYFDELDVSDQTALMERYNTQSLPHLQIKGKKPSQLVQRAFLRWVALDTWGEPTQDDLLAFAQELLSA